VNAELLASRAAASAAAENRIVMRVAHGGDVNNSYGYPAEAECVLVAALPPDRDGMQHVGVYAGQCPANKVTLAGAAARAFGSAARPIWDGRYGEAETSRAKSFVRRQAKADICFALGGEAAAKKRAARKAIAPAPLGLAQRLLVRLGRKAGLNPPFVDEAVRDGRMARSGQFLTWREKGYGHGIAYLPFGDQRDAEQFALANNQEQRRKIIDACGERVIPEGTRTLLQQDDFGQLYAVDTFDRDGDKTTVRQVRVVCPSTGAIYWLPVAWNCRTAHEAVAQTFGLSAQEYAPAAEA
jgi:hypothetical protein